MDTLCGYISLVGEVLIFAKFARCHKLANFKSEAINSAIT